MQRKSPELWINIGMDTYINMTPEKILPGIGLRPGGERSDLEPMIKKCISLCTYRLQYIVKLE
ncbi:hypothetical protein [Virgibacillus sp. Bac332]|nr:hypothetical protein [Virgibacillus sp. Bac332]